jgi:putative flippase GtrA
MLIKNKAQKIRFAVVGAINTLIDFGLFMGLGLTGIPAVGANYVSTTSALSFSFFANKKYTFKSQGKNYAKEIALFLAFTLFGLWVLQPMIIFFITKSLAQTNTSEWLTLVLAKGAATVVTLVWNYLTYSRFVFKSKLLNSPTE